jgi:hypothetical protein
MPLLLVAHLVVRSRFEARKVEMLAGFSPGWPKLDVSL